MTKIIAEIGWNHMGNLKLAKKMIIAAKKNGADYVKTQIFSTKNLKEGPWDKDGRRQIYEKAQLTDEKYKILKKFCKNKKINFFTSVFNVNDAIRVSKIHKDIIKIPSTEARNYKLLNFCNKKFKKILVSTGTLTANEIKRIPQYIRKKKLTLLHCVSSYPCKFENSNLPKINFLKKFSKSVGFSDHTSGVMASIISLTHNLEYIEKHFTVDKKLPGRDNKFAILPSELFELKEAIEISKKANKNLGNNYLNCEKETRKIYYGRWAKN